MVLKLIEESILFGHTVHQYASVLGGGMPLVCLYKLVHEQFGAIYASVIGYWGESSHDRSKRYLVHLRWIITFRDKITDREWWVSGATHKTYTNHCLLNWSTGFQFLDWRWEIGDGLYQNKMKYNIFSENPQLSRYPAYCCFDVLICNLSQERFEQH